MCIQDFDLLKVGLVNKAISNICNRHEQPPASGLPGHGRHYDVTRVDLPPNPGCNCLLLWRALFILDIQIYHEMSHVP